MISDVEARLRAFETELPALSLSLAQIQSLLLKVQNAGQVFRQIPNPAGSSGAQVIIAYLCNALKAVGAAVSVSGPSSFSASGTTDSAGKFTFTQGAAGSYTVTVTPTDTLYQATSQTFSLPDSGSDSITCNPVTGKNCFPCCVEPIPSTLHFTDSVLGSITLAWDAAMNRYWGSQLSGTITVCRPGCVSIIGGMTGQTAVIYQVQCLSGTWSLAVSYLGCTDSTSGLYLVPFVETAPLNTDNAGGITSGPLSAASASCSPVSVTWSPSGNPLPKIYSSIPTYTLTV